MIYGHTKFSIPSTNILLIIVIKPKDKYQFRDDPKLLFNSLQENTLKMHISLKSVITYNFGALY